MILRASCRPKFRVRVQPSNSPALWKSRYLWLTTNWPRGLCIRWSSEFSVAPFRRPRRQFWWKLGFSTLLQLAILRQGECSIFLGAVRTWRRSVLFELWWGRWWLRIVLVSLCRKGRIIREDNLCWNRILNFRKGFFFVFRCFTTILLSLFCSSLSTAPNWDYFSRKVMSRISAFVHPRSCIQLAEGGPGI